MTAMLTPGTFSCFICSSSVCVCVVFVSLQNKFANESGRDVLDVSFDLR